MIYRVLDRKDLDFAVLMLQNGANLLQKGELFIAYWGRFITNLGSYYKSGPAYYKLEQVLHIRVVLQVLQIGAEQISHLKKKFSFK